MQTLVVHAAGSNYVSWWLDTFYWPEVHIGRINGQTMFVSQSKWSPFIYMHFFNSTAYVLMDSKSFFRGPGSCASHWRAGDLDPYFENTIKRNNATEHDHCSDCISVPTVTSSGDKSCCCEKWQLVCRVILNFNPVVWQIVSQFIVRH